jgi:hypothetical protein
MIITFGDIILCVTSTGTNWDCIKERKEQTIERKRGRE